MTLDLDQNDPVNVRPIHFFMKDEQSRPVILLVNPEYLGPLLAPELDDDGTPGFSFDFDLKPRTPESLTLRTRDGQTIIRLNFEESPVLELSLPPQFLALLSSGGKVRWNRQPSGRNVRAKSRGRRSRRISLIAGLFQEISTPALSHTVSPDRTSATKLADLVSRGERWGTSIWMLDALEVNFKVGHNELTFPAAASRLNAAASCFNASRNPIRPIYFRWTISFDFLKGGPPSDLHERP